MTKSLADPEFQPNNGMKERGAYDVVDGSSLLLHLSQGVFEGRGGAGDELLGSPQGRSLGDYVLAAGADQGTAAAPDRCQLGGRLGR